MHNSAHLDTRKERLISKEINQAEYQSINIHPLQGRNYICVLPDEFLLKSVVIRVDFKRNPSGRTRIYDVYPKRKMSILMHPTYFETRTGLGLGLGLGPEENPDSGKTQTRARTRV